MKKLGRLVYWMAYGILIGGVAGVAHGKDKTVLDQTALVKGFESNYQLADAFDNKGFCKFGARTLSRGNELKELHLNAGHSKFQLKKRRTEVVDEDTNTTAPVHYMNVRWNLISQIQLPDMRIFNENDNKPPVLETDYCVEGGDLSKHFYAFGIRDLKNPHKNNRPNPHAFIYVPMNKRGKVSQYLGNSYYLFFFSIVHDTNQCNAKLADYPRCKALRELAVKQKDGMKGKEFREEVQKRITLILPVDCPYKVISVEFHNGVIHGSL